MFCRRQHCVWCEKKISWKNLIEALRNKSKEFLWTSKKFHQLASSFDLSRIRRKIFVLSAFVSFVSRYDGSKKEFSFFFSVSLECEKKIPFSSNYTALMVGERLRRRELNEKNGCKTWRRRTILFQQWTNNIIYNSVHILRISIHHEAPVPCFDPKKDEMQIFFSPGNFILLHSFHLLKLSVNRLWMGLCSLTIAKPRQTYRSRRPYPMPRLSLIKFELYESFDERVDKKEKIYSLPRNNIVIIISLVSNRVRYMWQRQHASE